MNRLIKQRTWIDVFPKKTYQWLIRTWEDTQHTSHQRNSNTNYNITAQLSEWLSSKRPQVTNVSEDACREKGTCVHCWWKWKYYISFSFHVWMWELDPKEVWALKNWFFQTVVLEKTLESLLDSKEIKPINPKGSQLWTFIRRTDNEAEAPKLWPPDAKSWLIGKNPDAGEDWGQEEKRAAEEEMVGWHHQLNGYEFEQTWR